jgi:hypothetical protein
LNLDSNVFEEETTKLDDLMTEKNPLSPVDLLYESKASYIKYREILF